MNDSTRKRGTRYDKIVQRQDDRQNNKARPSNPALTDSRANPEQVRRAEIATCTAEKVKFHIGCGRFDAAFDAIADAQTEMVPKTHRPSSTIEDVLGAKIGGLLEDRFGCEILLHLASLRESELRQEKYVGEVILGAIKKSLAMVGLELKPESQS